MVGTQHRMAAPLVRTEREDLHRIDLEQAFAAVIHMARHGVEGDTLGGSVSCCRLRGHRDKVFMRLENSDDEKSLEPRV